MRGLEDNPLLRSPPFDLTISVSLENKIFWVTNLLDEARKNDVKEIAPRHQEDMKYWRKVSVREYPARV